MPRINFAELLEAFRGKTPQDIVEIAKKFGGFTSKELDAAVQSQRQLVPSETGLSKYIHPTEVVGEASSFKFKPNSPIDAEVVNPLQIESKLMQLESKPLPISQVREPSINVLPSGDTPIELGTKIPDTWKQWLGKNKGALGAGAALGVGALGAYNSKDSLSNTPNIDYSNFSNPESNYDPRMSFDEGAIGNSVGIKKQTTPIRMLPDTILQYNNSPSEPKQEPPVEVVKKEEEVAPVAEEQPSIQKPNDIQELLNSFSEDSLGYKKNMQDAINATAMGQLISGLGRSASQIGAGIAGTTPPSDKIFTDTINLAGNFPKYHQLMIDNQKNDPNSPMSKQYKDLLAKMGYQVNEKLAASDLEKTLPLLMKMEQAKANAANKNKLLEDKKLNDKKKADYSQLFKLQDKLLQKDVTGRRTNIGQSQGIVLGADRLEQLAKAYGITPEMSDEDKVKVLNKLNYAQAAEVARGLDAILSLSGSSAVADRKKLQSESFISDIMKAWAYASNKNVSARLGKMLLPQFKMISREKETSKGHVNNYINNIVKTLPPEFLTNNYDDVMSMVKGSLYQTTMTELQDKKVLPLKSDKEVSAIELMNDLVKEGDIVSPNLNSTKQELDDKEKELKELEMLHNLGQ